MNPDVFGSDGGGDDKDVTGRVFVRPFSRGVLSGLGFGFAGSIGSATGSQAAARLPTNKTTAQLPYFSYRSGAIAYGERAHLGAQIYWAAGPAEVMAEAIESVQGAKLDSQSARFEHTAYAVQLAFLTTGERASWEGVVPRHPFDPLHGGLGALIVAVRNQGARFDPRVFPVFADPQTASKSAMSLGASVTWIWNSVFELQATWESTSFDGKRPTEHALLTRAQAAF